MHRMLSLLSKTTLSLTLIIVLAAYNSSVTPSPAKTPEESKNANTPTEAPKTTKVFKGFQGRTVHPQLKVDCFSFHLITNSALSSAPVTSISFSR